MATHSSVLPGKSHDRKAWWTRVTKRWDTIWRLKNNNNVILDKCSVKIYHCVW